MSTNTAAIVIGTTDQGRKVHMGYKATGQLLCTTTATAPVMTTFIADLDDEGGQENTLAILLTNRIAPSRLCGHCFFSRIRGVYKPRYTHARRILDLYADAPRGTAWSAGCIARQHTILAHDAQTLLGWLASLGLLVELENGTHPRYYTPRHLRALPTSH